MPMSMKKLAAAGEVKKSDLYKVRLQDLQVEEGFNLRNRDDGLEEHIEGLTKSIMAGAFVPPLAVRVTDDGVPVIVDGHCRREAYLRAVQRGAEIEYISCVEFKGNDADRVAAVITTAQGKPLAPLEMALGIKRLRAFGKTSQEIAAAIGKTATYVESLLLLADSNVDVQKAVASGEVAATTAIALVKKHGDGAGSVIKDASEQAKKEGKKKVTPKMVGEKLPPKKVMTSIYSQASALASSFSDEEIELMEKMDANTSIAVSPVILSALIRAVKNSNSKD